MEISPTREVQGNIFGFADADDLGCWIQEYSNSHKVLTLRVFCPSTKSVSNIIFSSTQYLSFSGRMGWQSANVELLPIDESINFARKLGQLSPEHEAESSPEQLEDIVAHICKVYRIQPKDGFNQEIIICAGRAYLSDKPYFTE